MKFEHTVKFKHH